MKDKRLLCAAATLSVSALAAIAITGCSQGSTSGASSGGVTSVTGTAIVVTVGDAPLANILSAKVTISAINLEPSGAGSAVTLLTSPRTIELSGLGAIQEPIETENIPAGTYNAAAVTVSAATVTYTDSTGSIVTGTATVNSPTDNVTLSPALTVTQGQDVHLSLNFNLAQSFDLTGSALTFTPSITSAAASIEKQSATDREVEVTGSVVSISSTSITVQSACTGVQSTFTINSSTQFSQSASTSSIKPGSIVTVHGTMQSDGSLLASMISASMNGQSMDSSQSGGRGIVTAVTGTPNGTVASFTFVPREDFGDMTTTTPMTVTLSPSTTYAVSEDAIQAGIAATAFTNAEIFPGQSVQVIGTSSGSNSIAAQEVDLAPESLSGTLTAVPQGASPTYTFTLQLPTVSFLTTYDSLSTLNGTTSAQTEYEGSLTMATFASQPSGTNLEMHGYLLLDSTNNYLLTVTNISSTEGSDH